MRPSNGLGRRTRSHFREASRDTDRQGLRIEARRRPGESESILSLAQPAPRELQHALLEPALDVPDLRRRDVRDFLPQIGVAQPGGPVLGESAAQELVHLAGDPGRHVHAVGDMADRHLRRFPLGPQAAPQAAGGVAMQGAHGVRSEGQTQRQGRHAECAVRSARVGAAERCKVFAGQPEALAQGPQVLRDRGSPLPILGDRHLRHPGCLRVRPVTV